MVKKYKAKPVEVEAFVYGSNAAAPLWFLKAIRSRLIHIMPSKGMVVAKTEAGKINFYDPKTFSALFETLEESKDLNKDGEVDAREEAIATETKKKRKTKPKKVEKEEKPSED